MTQVFQVKILEIDSLDKLEKIVLSRKRMGVHNITESEAKETFSKLSELIRNPTPRDIIWGAYCNDMLCSVLVQTFSGADIQDWLMSYLTVNPECKSSWNYTKNGLDECWIAAFNYAEKIGKTTVRWSLPVDWARTQERTKKTSLVWKEYSIHTYAIVKAGTMPSNKLDQWVAGKIKPYDVALKKAVKLDSPDFSIL